eukprot:4243062-Alexandrium_andersonii.AAC.1
MSCRPQKWIRPSWPHGRQQRASQSTPSPVAAKVMVLRIGSRAASGRRSAQARQPGPSGRRCTAPRAL